MKNELAWQERFNIGVNIIDKKHKKLFSIINKLVALCENETKIQFGCEEAIKFFKGYAVEHFVEEEAYMQSINYSGYEMHKRLHDNFKNKTLPALESELEKSFFSMDSIQHFVGVCVGWLTGHIMIEDMAIIGKASSNWENLPSRDEQSVLQQVIIQLMHDLFQIDAKIVSEHYNGEEFGESFHYSLTYHSDHKDRWKVLLCFENRFLTDMVGEMLGYKFHKVDEVVVNAIRFMSRQLLDGLKENFPSINLYELERENLLNHEQFVKLYKNNLTKYSFLFDSGFGYFSFCFIIPQSNKGIGLSLYAETATENIKKFLDTKPSASKKKILIVDDSSTLRHSIQKMLSDDYSTALAESGIAAIKSIIQNKPDLILLDYEMPICDGRQTLEMIRTDKDMADIPVIFLTGRSDKESIMKVMSLNPAGYLLKTTAHEEIKKNIDNFFENQKS